MSSPTVIRFRPIFRFLNLFLYLLLAAFLLWVRIMALSDRPWFSSPEEILADLLILASIGVTLYLGLARLTYRIEFDEQEVRVRHVPLFSLRRFSCAYSDIVQIQQGPYVIVVVPDQGRPWTIMPVYLEGGRKALLDVLARHVPADRFHEGLDISPEVRLQVARNSRRLVLIMAVFTLGWLLLEPNIGLFAQIRRHVAWKSAGRSSLFSSVKLLALDEEGRPWLVRDSLFLGYQVQHVGVDGVQVWNVPREFANWSKYGSPVAVAWDEAGNPIVVYQGHIVHRTGAEWQVLALPPDTPRLMSDYAQAWGTTMWAYTNVEDALTLIQLDLLSGEWQLLPLPAPIVPGKFELYGFRLIGDGSLMVAMGWQLRSHYLYRDGAWQEVGTPLEKNWDRIEGYTLDPSGQPWVLAYGYEEESYIVYRYDQAAGVWRRSRWTSPGIRYESIEVDDRGRAWLTGRIKETDLPDQVVDVLAPEPGETAQRLVRYTSGNSNYQQGIFLGSLHRGPDGRLWGADARLVWVDGAAAALPRPLPSWVEQVSRSQVLLGWGSLYFVLMVAQTVIIRRRKGK